MEPTIEGNERPKTLFRYQRFSELSLSALISQKIFFSHPSNFNDPHDCQYVFDTTSMTDAEVFSRFRNSSLARSRQFRFSSDSDWLHEKKGLAFIRSVVEKSAREAITKAFKNCGVCCFSSSSDNLLMWGHYADSHRGFCLEFDATFDPFLKAHPVKYRNDFPVINAISATLDEHYDKLLEDTLLSKPAEWRYENEWRIIHSESNKLYGYGKSLRGIYFGARMPKPHREIICNLFCRTGVNFYIMELGKQNYSVSATVASPFTQHPYFGGDPVEYEQALQRMKAAGNAP